MVGALPSWGAVFLAYALLGNVQWILAALTIAALKRPWLWSLQVVSKMTSAIGWWWHPLRGEWRAALEGAAVTVAIVGLSIVISPELWVQYAGFVGSNYDWPIHRWRPSRFRWGSASSSPGDCWPGERGPAEPGSSRSPADWRCRLCGASGSRRSWLPRPSGQHAERAGSSALAQAIPSGGDPKGRARGARGLGVGGRDRVGFLLTRGWSLASRRDAALVGCPSASSRQDRAR